MKWSSEDEEKSVSVKSIETGQLLKKQRPLAKRKP
jgi:hypothetical protein